MRCAEASRHALFGAALLLAGVPVLAAAPAAEPPSAAPLEISAEHGDIDRKAGVARYWGHVTLTRGTTRITADEVVLALADGELTKATITGKPATFAQSFGDGRAPTLGSAKTLSFSADQDVIELREDARVVQDGDEVTGDLIRYDAAKQRVLAAGGEQSGRVQMTITPRKPKPKPTVPPPVPRR